MGTRPMAGDPRPVPAGLTPTADPRLRRALLGVAWIVVLLATIWLLGRLGSGQLSTPPLLDRSALEMWLDGRDGVTVAFALVRLVGLALAWYLLVVTVVGLAARLSRLPGLVRLADLATVPAVRRVLGAVAGVGLTASAASLMAASLLPDQAPTPADAGDVGSRVSLVRVPDGSEVILRRLPDEDGTATMRIEEAPDQEAPDQAPVHEWTTAPGDHLWHIAEATLTDTWGRAPSDAEVSPYWDDVVEANRPRLSDPGNPDLIFPGQVFRLPTPPPPPAAPRG